MNSTYSFCIEDCDCKHFSRAQKRSAIDQEFLKCGELTLNDKATSNRWFYPQNRLRVWKKPLEGVIETWQTKVLFLTVYIRLIRSHYCIKSVNTIYDSSKYKTTNGNNFPRINTVYGRIFIIYFIYIDHTFCRTAKKEDNLYIYIIIYNIFYFCLQTDFRSEWFIKIFMSSNWETNNLCLKVKKLGYLFNN